MRLQHLNIKLLGSFSHLCGNIVSISASYSGESRVQISARRETIFREVSGVFIQFLPENSGITP
jgi:hypothetical protein